MTTWLELIGKKTLALIREMGAVIVFFGQTLRWTFSSPFYFKNLLKQMEQIGVNSVPVVLTTAISTGIRRSRSSRRRTRRASSRGRRATSRARSRT